MSSGVESPRPSSVYARMADIFLRKSSSPVRPAEQRVALSHHLITTNHHRVRSVLPDRWPRCRTMVRDVRVMLVQGNRQRSSQEQHGNRYLETAYMHQPTSLHSDPVGRYGSWIQPAATTITPYAQEALSMQSLALCQNKRLTECTICAKVWSVTTTGQPQRRRPNGQDV